MDPGRIAWVAGAYLAGTLPSAWLVARADRTGALHAEAGRRAGEADAHVLMVTHLGWGWATLASTADVLKGLLVVLAARRFGRLDPPWLAAAGVAAVLGHTFPPYLSRWAGRGLATAAGVLLALLPLQMVVAGALIVIGVATHASGALSTLGMASVPFVAAVQRQPAAFVWMGGAIFVVLLVRRLEGVGDVVAAGVSWPRAVIARAVFDVSARPPAGRRGDPA